MGEEDDGKSVGELVADDLASSDANPAGNFMEETKNIPVDNFESKSTAVAEGDFKPDIDFRALMMNIEKLNAKVEALREVKFQSDERLKELAESVGELRSMSFQRENAITELEAKFGNIEETMESAKPEAVLKRLEERDRQIEDFSVKLEKLETMSKDIVEQMRDVQKVVSTLRSISEVMDASKDLTMKVRKMEDVRNSTERFATKAEKIFYEMDKRLTDFTLFKAKVNQMEELTRELLKATDQNKIKIEETPTKDELNEMRVALNQLAQGEAMEKPFTVAAVKRAVRSTIYPKSSKAKPMPLPRDAESLSHMREEVQVILSMLEDEYREGTISERTFYEARTKNEKRLEEIEAQLKDVEAAVAPREELTEVASAAPAVTAAAKAPSPEKIPGEPDEEEQLALPSSFGALRAKKREVTGYLKLLLQDKEEKLISHRDFMEQKKKLSSQLRAIDQALAKVSADAEGAAEEAAQAPLDELKAQVKSSVAGDSGEFEEGEKEGEDDAEPKAAPKKSSPKKSQSKPRRR